MWTLLGAYCCGVSTYGRCVLAESLRYQRFDNGGNITLLRESKISLELVHRIKDSRQAECGKIYIRNALMAAHIWRPNIDINYLMCDEVCFQERPDKQISHTTQFLFHSVNPLNHMGTVTLIEPYGA